MAFYQEHYFGKYVANGFSEEKIFFFKFYTLQPIGQYVYEKVLGPWAQPQP